MKSGDINNQEMPELFDRVGWAVNDGDIKNNEAQIMSAIRDHAQLTHINFILSFISSHYRAITTVTSTGAGKKAEPKRKFLERMRNVCAYKIASMTKGSDYVDQEGVALDSKGVGVTLPKSMGNSGGLASTKDALGDATDLESISNDLVKGVIDEKGVGGRISSANHSSQVENFSSDIKRALKKQRAEVDGLKHDYQVVSVLTISTGRLACLERFEINCKVRGEQLKVKGKQFESDRFKALVGSEDPGGLDLDGMEAFVGKAATAQQIAEIKTAAENVKQPSEQLQKVIKVCEAKELRNMQVIMLRILQEALASSVALSDGLGGLMIGALSGPRYVHAPEDKMNAKGKMFDVLRNAGDLDNLPGEKLMKTVSGIQQLAADRLVPGARKRFSYRANATTEFYQ